MSAWAIAAAIATVALVFGVAFHMGFSAGTKRTALFLGRLHAAAARRTGDSEAAARIVAATEDPAVRWEAAREREGGL